MTSYINSDGSGLIGALGPTNFGQSLRLDASGNLLVSGGSIQSAIQSGKGFVATTGKQNASGAMIVAFSLYNNSAVGVLLYSLTCLSSSAKTHQLTRGTSNLALGSNAYVSNTSLGGSSSSLALGSVTYANSNQAVSGTPLDAFATPTTQPIEILSQGNSLYLPASSGTNLTLYLDLAAAGDWKVTYRWIEI
ncbi:hypothetical protein [Ktedonospora formicarum]|uniref:Uncharacterized protein n=1 Tax=Ktedonospora formicarum TaxID=2778364 RepID=A0A8J3I0Y5_9CHLR|nr:hypothetical protein [Ktedonospora formicarum]GHO47987.1 hypothetical protein KSX_61500 [Ktedonospora formicarum]